MQNKNFIMKIIQRSTWWFMRSKWESHLICMIEKNEWMREVNVCFVVFHALKKSYSKYLGVDITQGLHFYLKQHPQQQHQLPLWFTKTNDHDAFTTNFWWWGSMNTYRWKSYKRLTTTHLHSLRLMDPFDSFLCAPSTREGNECTSLGWSSWIP